MAKNDEPGILGIPKSFYTLEHGWLSIPIGLIVGLFLFCFQLTSILFQKGMESRIPAVRYFTYFMAFVCFLDFLLWSVSRNSAPELHDSYGTLFLYALGSAFFMYAFFIGVVLLMVGIKALIERTTFMDQIKKETSFATMFDTDPLVKMDKDGNIVPAYTDEDEVLRKKHYERSLAEIREGNEYADRRFREEYQASSASRRLDLSDNKDDYLDDFSREWRHSDEYETWCENYDNPKVEKPKKPRKPRVKKVAPVVKENPDAVTNDWLAERNAKEANRRA